LCAESLGIGEENNCEMRRFDVAVIGGGPAGSACALKCVEKGFKTLLLEKAKRKRRKICGGVVPLACEDLLNMEFGIRIPPSVLASPSQLGMFYVPPSGRTNGGAMRNYKLLNIRRDLFDQWLRDEAERRGTEVFYGSEFLRFEAGEETRFLVKSDGELVTFETKYLVGADGAASRVRSQIFQNLQLSMLTIVQETWKATGELGDYFYVFFRDEISPTYGYAIPKDGLFLVGACTLRERSPKPTVCVDRLREWLSREFSFQGVQLKRREASQIPFDAPPEGRGNVVLVGDAGGFCNPFSGEGIRFAVNSGVAAAEAAKISEQKSQDLASIYRSKVEPLREFHQKMRNLADGMDDAKKEAFVKTELSRFDVFS